MFLGFGFNEPYKHWCNTPCSPEFLQEWKEDFLVPVMNLKPGTQIILILIVFIQMTVPFVYKTIIIVVAANKKSFLRLWKARAINSHPHKFELKPFLWLFIVFLRIPVKHVTTQCSAIINVYYYIFYFQVITPNKYTTQIKYTDCTYHYTCN